MVCTTLPGLCSMALKLSRMCRRKGKGGGRSKEVAVRHGRRVCACVTKKVTDIKNARRSKRKEGGRGGRMGEKIFSTCERRKGRRDKKKKRRLQLIQQQRRRRRTRGPSIRNGGGGGGGGRGLCGGGGERGRRSVLA